MYTVFRSHTNVHANKSHASMNIFSACILTSRWVKCCSMMTYFFSGTYEWAIDKDERETEWRRESERISPLHENEWRRWVYVTSSRRKPSIFQVTTAAALLSVTTQAAAATQRRPRWRSSCHVSRLNFFLQPHANARKRTKTHANESELDTFARLLLHNIQIRVRACARSTL